MCGISLAIRKNQLVPDIAILGRMNERVHHRGPDDEGVYFSGSVGLGHRRLSIIDLSQGGHQPMARKNLILTFNGEIYNYLELREELAEMGQVFHSQSDTEVILAAYAEWGVQAFSRFNGMWAFALLDEEKQEVILCRDHFGIKPIHYTATETYFAAGSEIKQFFEIPDFRPVLNHRTAANFLAKGQLNFSSETLYKGVGDVLPGHYVQYDLKTDLFYQKPWYHLDQNTSRRDLTISQATQAWREHFLDSVHLRMRSDVRVGSCLSGGLDSSSIVMAVDTLHEKIDTFETVTSCFEQRAFDESSFSDRITEVTGFPNHKVYPSFDYLLRNDLLDKIIYHQDQPIPGLSHFSEHMVFQKAWESGLTVMLDGQGADEYLCGYREFYLAYLRDLVSTGRLKKAWAFMRQRAGNLGKSVWAEAREVFRSMVVFPVKSALKDGLSKKKSLLSGEWQKITDYELFSFHARSVRDLSLEEMKYTSLPYQLHSEDRNSMMFSIESRLPFLDHRLVEYSISLPSEFKLQKGYTKFIIREAMDELPPEVRWRTDKMGFVAPEGPWMKENHEWVRSQLAAALNETPFFHPDLLTQFDRFVNGQAAYDNFFFRAVSFYRFIKVSGLKITPYERVRTRSAQTKRRMVKS